MTTNVYLQEVGHILTCWSFICKWHNVIFQDKRPNQEALQTAEQAFVHVFILYFADPESCACVHLCVCVCACVSKGEGLYDGESI